MKQFIDLVGEKLTVKLPQDKIKDYGKTIIWGKEHYVLSLVFLISGKLKK